MHFICKELFRYKKLLYYENLLFLKKRKKTKGRSNLNRFEELEYCINALQELRVKHKRKAASLCLTIALIA